MRKITRHYQALVEIYDEADRLEKEFDRTFSLIIQEIQSQFTYLLERCEDRAFGAKPQYIASK